jgi:mRNA interferase RelE/StbE
MNRFEVRLSRDAEKALLKIRQSLPVIGRKIEKTLDLLETHPFAGSKLEGSDGEVRRIRIGDFRVVYEIYRHEILILVVYIGPRGGAYRQ